MVNLDQKKALFNPLTHDFSYEWLDDKNQGHTIVLPALELSYLPPSQYEFMKKHLIDAIVEDRELNQVEQREEIKEITKEVEVSD